MRSRVIAFAVVCTACVLVGGGWVLIAALSGSNTTSDAKVGVTGGTRLDLRGRVLVRAVDRHDPRLNGRATFVRLGARPGKTRAGKLACARIYERAGHGICLYTAASGVDYRMAIFDSRNHIVHEARLDGLPSRARVSPSGRWGAVTTFVNGHSYATEGGFSTKTLILDMASGKPLANLEQFSAEQDGKTIDRPDFNYWGTTFARDDDTFYATLGTNGKRYLVRGSLHDRHVKLLREHVECPSLSPDETRVAYKKRVGGSSDWRLHVLDLKTGRDTPLAETHVVDDQAEWLDNGTILYGRAGSVWAVRADGTGQPERVLARAASPATISD